jgi:hypothetical protein
MANDNQKAAWIIPGGFFTSGFTQHYIVICGYFECGFFNSTNIGQGFSSMVGATHRQAFRPAC